MTTLDLAPAQAKPEQLAADGAMLLGRGDATQALRCLRGAISLGDRNPVTLLNLALAEAANGATADARARMAGLEAACPEWDEPPLRLAESYRAAEELAEAEAAYRRVLTCNPHRREALLALSGLLLGRREAREARVLLTRCAALHPESVDAWRVLGVALAADGEPALAHAAFVRAHTLNAGSPELALLAAEGALAAGMAEAECARLEAAFTENPLNAALLIARGVLLERLGRRAEAIELLQAATMLAPEDAFGMQALGGLLARANQLTEAARILARAHELDAADARVANDLAAVLMRLHRHAEARTLLVDAMAAQGEQTAMLCNLANATVSLGEQETALVLAERAVAREPDAVLPRRALCNVLPYTPGVDGAKMLTAARECSARLPRSAPPQFGKTRDPERPLTVGLLSGSLRTHPVGWLTIAGCEWLERPEFSLICLSQTSAPSDAMQQRFRSVAAEWHHVDALDDVALADHAHALGIDLLIDLGGYGDASRMTACAYRLAPVQIKWVGMQYHSSGLAEMDWFLTDRWETPAGFERLYSERLLRLPDGYVCYSPPPYAPDVTGLPARHTGHVTFGCFNNLAKITPRVLDAWGAILQRLPSARLVLKTHQFEDAGTCARILSAFEQRGVDASRVTLRGPSRHRDFMAEYGQIDICLDPFPYSGGLTTCEALWMGVPTVTLPGETFASRHSLSHLSNVGLEDWAACDLESYVALAVAKASDLETLWDLRAGLRARVKASPLCDAPRFGRNLGAALRHAWRAWCAEGEGE